MKTTKRVALFLAIVMLATTFLAGCGQNSGSKDQTGSGTIGQGTETTTAAADSNFNPTGFPIVKEPITLKLMGSKAAIEGDWNEMDYFKSMTKITNIQFNCEAIPSESWAEKKNLAFASGDLPDIFMSNPGLSSIEQGTYGSQGILLALNSYIEKYGDNIKAMFEKLTYIKGVTTAADGNIYALPRINELPRDMHSRYWINAKWLENVGKPMPATLDDYYNALVAFRDGDPNKNGKADEIPVANDNSGFYIDGLILAALGFNVVNPVSATKPELFDARDGKVIFIPTTEEYKYYLEYMNRLYKEKLLDNESFTQTNQQLTAKGKEMRLGSFYAAASYLTTTVEQGYDYSFVGPLTSQYSDKKLVPTNGGISGEGVIAITSANKYPDATFRWIDYCYSREGSILGEVGTEGTGWNWIDKSKGTWDKITAEGYATAEETRAAIITPPGTPPAWYPTDFALGQGSKNAFWLNELTDKYYAPYFNYKFPSLFFTEEEQNAIKAIQLDMDKYVRESRARFIIGDLSLDNWDSYVSTLNNMKVGELLKYQQAAYDRYLEAIK